jgi:hypothetical protein
LRCEVARTRRKPTSGIGLGAAKAQDPDQIREQRSAGWAFWHANAAGLGGWTFVTRISLTTLQATATGFFGLYGSTAALATTLTLATATNCIGFQRSTPTLWQLIANDGSGAPTLTDMGASFGIMTSGVLTLFIAPPHGSPVRVRGVDEVSGGVFEPGVTADLPTNTQFRTPADHGLTRPSHDMRLPDTSCSQPAWRWNGQMARAPARASA